MKSPTANAEFLPLPAGFQMSAERRCTAGARSPLPDATKFILAGNAIFTAHSEKTSQHFTFRVKRADPKESHQPPPQLWFVSVLTGPDNQNDYQYLGLIRPPILAHTGQLGYEHGAKSKIRAEAASARAARWVLGNLLLKRPTPGCTVYHEGRCGRCNRALTVPESILSGFGPECIQHV